MLSHLIDLNHSLVWQVHKVFSRQECLALARWAQEKTFDVAMILRDGQQHRDTRVRNNERLIIDDVRLAELLYNRVRAHCPNELSGMQLASANSRCRVYRYLPGQYFAPHYDGAFVASETKRSLLTMLLYLEDDCVGGETEFLDLDLSVRPRVGSVVLFQHHVLHRGCEVVSGRKLVLRTDIMYCTEMTDSG